MNSSRCLAAAGYAACLLISLPSPSCLASGPGAAFTPLGYLPGGDFYSEANDVSANGAVVVGEARSTTGNQAFRWTRQSGLEALGDLPGGDMRSIAQGVSDDGTVVVGRGSIQSSVLADGFRWTQGDGMQPVGHFNTPDFTFSYALAVSGDGRTVVGSSGSSFGAVLGTEAFIWTPESGLQGLGDLPGGGFESFANGISADGKVIVGESQSTIALEAMRWTADSGMQGLGFLPGLVVESHAWGVSADGTMIVGSSGRQGWTWTAESGMQPIPHLPSGARLPVTEPFGAANNGVVVGHHRDGANSGREKAFVWDRVHGTRALQDVLMTDYGLALGPGWTLTHANAISDDGTVIVGRGINPAGRTEGWVIDLAIPEPSGNTLAATALMLGFTCCRFRRTGAAD